MANINPETNVKEYEYFVVECSMTCPFEDDSPYSLSQCFDSALPALKFAVDKESKFDSYSRAHLLSFRIMRVTSSTPVFFTFHDFSFSEDAIYETVLNLFELMHGDSDKESE